MGWCEPSIHCEFCPFMKQEAGHRGKGRNRNPWKQRWRCTLHCHKTGNLKLKGSGKDGPCGRSDLSTHILQEYVHLHTCFQSPLQIFATTVWGKLHGHQREWWRPGRHARGCHSNQLTKAHPASLRESCVSPSHLSGVSYLSVTGPSKVAAV